MFARFLILIVNALVNNNYYYAIFIHSNSQNKDLINLIEFLSLPVASYVHLV